VTPFIYSLSNKYIKRALKKICWDGSYKRGNCTEAGEGPKNAGFISLEPDIAIPQILIFIIFLLPLAILNL